jgi:hypothetical protein
MGKAGSFDKVKAEPQKNLPVPHKNRPVPHTDNRELVEPPSVFCDRIGTNVAKVVNKKKNKKGGGEENQSIPVQFLSEGKELTLGG